MRQRKGFRRIKITGCHRRVSTPTLVHSLAPDLDLKKITRELKKHLATNAAILQSEKFGSVIQLQGDMRQKVADFLVSRHICEACAVKIYGA